MLILIILLKKLLKSFLAIWRLKAAVKFHCIRGKGLVNQIVISDLLRRGTPGLETIMILLLMSSICDVCFTVLVFF